MGKSELLETRLRLSFAEHCFGRPDVVVQAPGRVNLIGEHTDYNDGFVLPCAIDFRTLVAARSRADRQVRVLALDEGAAWDGFSLDAPQLQRGDAAWANYVRGMVWALQHAGHELQGADLVITGDVPLGAGLSSSASLLVAVGQAFVELQALQGLPPQQLALLAQRAENDFVGCRVGIMDPMISACGVAGHALLLDCRSLQATPVPMPAGLAVLIVHSKVRRGLLDSAYNLRRRQCEQAARHFGVPALRDVTSAQLADGAPGLDATVWRRARHVVTENERTLAAAQSLGQGRMDLLGQLMVASQASMRDDFEITTPAIDQLVEIVPTRSAMKGACA